MSCLPCRLCPALLVCSFLLFSRAGLAQSPPRTPPSKIVTATLAQELQRLHLREALVIPINGVLDDFPRWSPDGSKIAVKFNGKWGTVDLNHVHLVATTWHHGAKVGAIDSQSSFASATAKQISSFKPFSEAHPQKTILNNGTILELPNEGLSTTLRVTRKGHKPEIWWTTGMENCYIIAPSPGEKYVAYISELNGIAVMTAPK